MRAAKKSAVISFIAAVAMGFSARSSIQAADGSPSDLRIIDAKTLPSFKADFNTDVDAMRLVLLLSPT